MGGYSSYKANSNVPAQATAGAILTKAPQEKVAVFRGAVLAPRNRSVIAIRGRVKIYAAQLADIQRKRASREALRCILLCSKLGMCKPGAQQSLQESIILNTRPLQLQAAKSGPGCKDERRASTYTSSLNHELPFPPTGCRDIQLTDSIDGSGCLELSQRQPEWRPEVCPAEGRVYTLHDR